MISLKCVTIFLTFLFIINLSCDKPESKSGKINIIVSIVPLAEFVEKVGGDKVSVSTMVPPGASPHTYEPKPNQLVEVSKADMYIKVGSPVEFELVWLDKIFSMNSNMDLVDASKGIELLEMKHEIHEGEQHEKHHRESTHPDPHIWLSPVNAKMMVRNIYNGVAAIDPKNQPYYRVNCDAYLKELDTLDQEIEHKLTSLNNKKFMVYHPAWGYFAARYRLEQIPVEAEGKEPTAKGIQNLIEQARQNNIKTIFASPQFNKNSAELIAKEIDGEVVLISSLEKNYIANMKKITDYLTKLKLKPSSN